MKNQYEQFLKLRTQLSKMTTGLSSLGIHLEARDSACINYTLNWQEHDAIVEKVKALDYFSGLNQSEELALALAVTQENQNAFIGQDQIKTVNDFFGLNITFDMVQKFNSEYI